ncbi:hypothetical protein H9I32_09890 [Bacillus sp. Xin]|uniref:hypothetical protein n=1 Tax=unclassified Bacillus (in: firmicutes) TaxID=185979 RepID=UPI001573FBBE|nr:MULTISPECIES: hypothetical protein [unclassified Bacillus (in: firmicutes)]MBC6972690.1 hypothetical protein [Bacillus sp. Xin]NSW38834.1 hypothetical protein [Bacillus sp. Xin1]
MNKVDAIFRLLMEMKLELKEVKEQVEQMHTSLKNIEEQNQKREIPSTVSKKKPDWKYPSKMK